MADDPYKILGLEKTASAADIRKAYRALAKKHHPDLNPGTKAAEETFKAVSAANELLSDEAKRARYDRGEIDAAGAEKAPRPSYRHYADSSAGERYAYGGSPNSGAGGFAGADFEDLFSTIFNNRAGAGPASGQDAHYSLNVAFLDAINGATSRLTLPDGQTLDVKIPPGSAEGQILRLRGRGYASGNPGRNNGPAGDALIEIHIDPHPVFTRDGQSIHLNLPITLQEAVLGAKITIPTPAGPVAMTVKPHTETGAELRLRGRGVPAHGKLPAGDLFVKLHVLIGTPDTALENFLRGWQPTGATNPRAEIERAMGQTP